MSGDLLDHQSTALEPVRRETSATALERLLGDVRALTEIPVETVTELHRIHRIEVEDARRVQFNAAFVRVQRAMTPVLKRGKNDQTGSAFARLEDVERMLAPLREQHGFSQSLSTRDCPVPEHIRFVLTIRHEAGHQEEHTLDAPIDDRGIKGNTNKTKLWGMGSSMSYVERYLTVNVWGVQCVLRLDDDAQRASGFGPGVETISDEQAADLQATIEELGVDRARFLATYGVERFEDLTAANLRGAHHALEQRRRMQR